MGAVRCTRSRSYSCFPDLTCFVFSPFVCSFLLRPFCRAYIWFFKISRLRLDPSAYSALKSGPDDTATSAGISSPAPNPMQVN